MNILNINNKKNNCKGFTLVEILMASIVLLPVFVSTFVGFIKGMELSEMARHSSQALTAVKSKISEIENTAFDQIKNNFDLITFTTNGLNGIGVSYVDDSQPNILQINTTFCWQEKNGRIMGDDRNLNGQEDAGEDPDNDNILDSPVLITTVIYNS